MDKVDFDMGATQIDEGDDFLSAAQGPDGAVRCVFSSMEKIKVGTGTTTRQHVTKIYWYVEELGEGLFSLRKLNAHYVPVDVEQTITLEELAERYLPEIEFWEDKTIPAMNELETHLEDGEHDFEERKFYSAERSFNKALRIDEQNIRALFHLGLVYMELNVLDKARDMMTELLKVKSPFQGKDQHLFNEFGIALRKKGMYEEAVTYYGHALRYIDDDENLYYNIARAHYERGDWEECVKMLTRSRTIDPTLPLARDLSDLLMELSSKPWLCEECGKPPVPRELTTSIRAFKDMKDSMEVERGDVLKPQKGRVRTSGVIYIDSKK